MSIFVSPPHLPRTVLFAEVAEEEGGRGGRKGEMRIMPIYSFFSLRLG